MSSRIRHRAVLAACALLLTGCGSARAVTDRAPATSMPTGTGMTAGMLMPDGSTMGAARPDAPARSGPSDAALMICSAKTRAGIAKALALPAVPTADATWRDHTYTCRYRLPAGPFVVTVTESADAAGARSYLGALRRRLGSTHAVPGLTDIAFGTSTGTVVLVKDSDVLHVDATALPTVFGSQHERRTDFAYEVASDILGCWTGGG